jgi:hypothetical protein
MEKLDLTRLSKDKSPQNLNREKGNRYVYPSPYGSSRRDAVKRIELLSQQKII